MIEHDGVIVKSTDNRATVRILNKSACVSCEVSGKCNLSDIKEKEIDVYTNGKTYVAGDKVIVTGAESMGFKALFLGYIFPFIILLSTMLTLSYTGFSELTAGLSALGTLIPYYIGLKLMNHKIQKQFSFYLKNR
ncbi:MAG: Fis family transcriptional regulator [Salinivirgaceae bacterium]|nr:MAG: Fis family transcriptional regulator [Salinivirgaceae bacterium]